MDFLDKGPTGEWTEEEALLHLDSGRLVSRECPDTPNVWEYKDTNKVSVEQSLTRGKELQRSRNEMQPETQLEDAEEWDQAWAAFGSTNSFNDVSVFGSGGKRKGKGKLPGKPHESDHSNGKPNGGKPKAVETDPDQPVDAKKLNA